MAAQLNRCLRRFLRFRIRERKLSLLVLLIPLTPIAAQKGYVGKEVCQQCHTDQAQQHDQSNFASSWQPVSSLAEEGFPVSTTEDGIVYKVEKVDGKWVYRVQLPQREVQTFPIHSIIGGERWGTSFMLEVSHIESSPLPRLTLVEGRYMLDAETHRLIRSPGFPIETPVSYETALGRTLSPEFAEKCLDCHGGMVDSQIARSGGPHPDYLDTAVGCERCHGPGGAHVSFFQTGTGKSDIINPAKLSHPEVMNLCGECHSGFFTMIQTRPDDLLIASQVLALSNSECYIQSEAGFSCVSCHDPHRNAYLGDPVYEQTCLSCHSAQKAAAVSCPVNSRSDCVSCHMPEVVQSGQFELRDHWIRVPDGEGARGSQVADSSDRSKPVKDVFLRILVVSSQAKVEEVLKRLQVGESFSALARQHSTDVSATRGGYLGRMSLQNLNREFRLAVESLAPGRYSDIIRSGPDYALLYRIPNNFRTVARQMERRAGELQKEEEIDKAIELLEQSVELNPEFAQGYLGLGVAHGQKGDNEKEAQYYLRAIEVYPDLIEAHYNLGVLRLAQKDFIGAIQSFQHVIRIKPDAVQAYVNLAVVYQALGNRRAELEAAKKAVELNPLLATAYYNLGVAQGAADHRAALDSFRMSAAVDPRRIDAKLNMAIAMAHLGSTDEAIEHLQNLLAEHPDFAQARQALMLLQQGPADKQGGEKR